MLNILQQIVDKRRKQGQKFQQHYILFFAIIAVASGCSSYREIAIFIKTHFKFLKKRFKLKWKNVPAYTTIRNIIKGVDTNELEQVFREHAKSLQTKYEQQLTIDGKTVRGSFDRWQDKEAVQVLSAFLVDDQLIVGHKFFDKDKTNEIPMMHELLDELNIDYAVVTADAMHCQKKH